jgi:Tol biopolymer transport system component
VFERWAPRNVSGLFTVRANGTHLRRITPWRPDDGDPFDWSPDWSPDGRWILFNHANGGAVQQMCLIHPNGSGFRRITHGTAFSWSWGSFSPDGTMITVMRAPGEASENDIYVMNLDGSEVTPLTGSLSTEEAEGAPDWGPRG